LIGTNRVNLIVGWCGRFLFFVVPRQFLQGIGEWPENQILISDWTYFHCPGATLHQGSIFLLVLVCGEYRGSVGRYVCVLSQAIFIPHISTPRTLIKKPSQLKIFSQFSILCS